MRAAACSCGRTLPYGRGSDWELLRDASTVYDLVLLQVPLDRFERRQIRCAVSEQIILNAADALGSREHVLPRRVSFAENRRVAIVIRRTVGEQQALRFSGILLHERDRVRTSATANVHVDV